LEKGRLQMPKLFVGNIPHAASVLELRQWVESRGFRVDTVEIIYDRITGKSRGFGFIGLSDPANLQNAIGVLNGRRMGGRVLTVNEATPLTSKPEQMAGAPMPMHDPT
jgi:cold-inducible RNA-binding protein